MSILWEVFIEGDLQTEVQILISSLFMNRLEKI